MGAVRTMVVVPLWRTLAMVAAPRSRQRIRRCGDSSAKKLMSAIVCAEPRFSLISDGILLLKGPVAGHRKNGWFGVASRTLRRLTILGMNIPPNLVLNSHGESRSPLSVDARRGSSFSSQVANVRGRPRAVRLVFALGHPVSTARAAVPASSGGTVKRRPW